MLYPLEPLDECTWMTHHIIFDREEKKDPYYSHPSHPWPFLIHNNKGTVSTWFATMPQRHRMNALMLHPMRSTWITWHKECGHGGVKDRHRMKGGKNNGIHASSGHICNTFLSPER